MSHCFSPSTQQWGSRGHSILSQFAVMRWFFTCSFTTVVWQLHCLAESDRAEIIRRLTMRHILKLVAEDSSAITDTSYFLKARGFPSTLNDCARAGYIWS